MNKSAALLELQRKRGDTLANGTVLTWVNVLEAWVVDLLQAQQDDTTCAECDRRPAVMCESCAQHLWG